jgi:WD40 repeat protein
MTGDGRSLPSPSPALHDAAQPAYIFRGHLSPIHSVRIAHRNTWLVTGDADGWVVCWTLESKRPLAVWRAHEGAILATAEWGPEKLITCVGLCPNMPNMPPTRSAYII